MGEWVELDTDNKVIAHWKGVDGKPHPRALKVDGRTDGPHYMGRTYTTVIDRFTPYVPPPPTRREELKNKPKDQWTLENVAEALQELL